MSIENKDKKDIAIAILISGRSFEEASKISNIKLDELYELWDEYNSE